MTAQTRKKNLEYRAADYEKKKKKIHVAAVEKQTLVFRLS